MRILGLDLGAKRIGLAISDSEGSIAFPMETLQHRDLKKDLEAICAVIIERGVERAVVGLPIHLDGRRGVEAERAEAFAASLAKKAGIEVDTLDERWTTLEAERSLRATGRRAKRQREVVDAVAASILLRTYLEIRSRSASDSGESDSNDRGGAAE